MYTIFENYFNQAVAFVKLLCTVDFLKKMVIFESFWAKMKNLRSENAEKNVDDPNCHHETHCHDYFSNGKEEDADRYNWDSVEGIYKNRYLFGLDPLKYSHQNNQASYPKLLVQKTNYFLPEILRFRERWNFHQANKNSTEE